jgi:hypothetical protein
VVRFKAAKGNHGWCLEAAHRDIIVPRSLVSPYRFDAPWQVVAATSRPSTKLSLGYRFNLDRLEHLEPLQALPVPGSPPVGGYTLNAAVECAGNGLGRYVRVPIDFGGDTDSILAKVSFRHITALSRPYLFGPSASPQGSVPGLLLFLSLDCAALPRPAHLADRLLLGGSGRGAECLRGFDSGGAGPRASSQGHANALGRGP